MVFEVIVGSLTRRGVIREGGLLLTHAKNFIQMVLCISSSLFALKNVRYLLQKMIHISLL